MITTKKMLDTVTTGGKIIYKVNGDNEKCCVYNANNQYVGDMQSEDFWTLLRGEHLFEAQPAYRDVYGYTCRVYRSIFKFNSHRITDALVHGIDVSKSYGKRWNPQTQRYENIILTKEE